MGGDSAAEEALAAAEDLAALAGAQAEEEEAAEAGKKVPLFEKEGLGEILWKTTIKI